MTLSKHTYSAALVTTQTLEEETLYKIDAVLLTAWSRPATYPNAQQGTSNSNVPIGHSGRLSVWFLRLVAGVTTGATQHVITGLTPGRKYTAALWVCNRSVALTDPTATLGASTVPVTNQWTEVRSTFVAAATTHTLTLTFTVGVAAATNQTLSFDDLMVTAWRYMHPPVETPLGIVDGVVALDESWSPFVSASLTIPLPPADVMARVDPRVKARIRLTARQEFGTSQPLSALNGATLATLSARFAGQMVLGVSATFGVGYNPEGVRPPTARTFDLAIRGRNVSRLEGDVKLTASSDEGYLMDYAPPYQLVSGTTVRDAVALALARIGAILEPGTDNAPVEINSTIWHPGVSAAEFVQPLVDAAGLRLYCDEQRRWFLTRPLHASDRALYLDERGIQQSEDVVSRDDGWFDAMTVTYRWTDVFGVAQVRHDVAAPAGYSRMGTVQYDRQWPGDGAAAALLARAEGRGQVSGVSAVSDYDAEPGALLSVSIAGFPTQTGVVSRVEWLLSNDTMAVRSRDLASTPPYSWLAQPVGLNWEDIPAGVTWLTYTPPTT